MFKKVTSFFRGLAGRKPATYLFFNPGAGDENIECLLHGRLAVLPVDIVNGVGTVLLREVLKHGHLALGRRHLKTWMKATKQ